LLFLAIVSTSAFSDEDKPYQIKCNADRCRVDNKTYIGWQVYHQYCYACHAQDGVGSTFAPNLLKKLKIMGRSRFIAIVSEGYRGKEGVMPAWKDNPDVNPYLAELYIYLKARSDGALPAGRLQATQILN
jgi:mono/diheme cytochrome c family protein